MAANICAVRKTSHLSVIGRLVSLARAWGDFWRISNTQFSTKALRKLPGIDERYTCVLEVTLVSRRQCVFSLQNARGDQ